MLLLYRGINKSQRTVFQFASLCYKISNFVLKSTSSANPTWIPSLCM